MIEDILNYISSLTPTWIYVALFLFSFLENIFPPSPSDLVVVIGGSLVSKGTIDFVPAVLTTTLGSIIGFVVIFYFGSTVDKKLIRAGKIRFVSIETLDKVEQWFNKYGYGIIVANRFLPGTRAVISFFAGLSELNLKKSILLASISALAWNSIIIYLGLVFGDHVEIVDKYLGTYSNAIVILTLIILIFFAIKYFIKKRKKLE
ncbi:MAG: DedA family protein [Ignavibacteriaceae bacterium]|nr:DedA family protein [Ignavibacteriaceae bacterium]